jgi:excisionase family DNA binding protein
LEWAKCRLIGVSPGTVYEVVARGDLKAASAGSKKLITRRTLAEFLGAPRS